jgi:ATP-dependent DNA helicase UvrD/PcrA
MSRDYLNDLNESQRRAVTYGVPGSLPFRSGPVGVIAGAGTGKTKTIAYRVAHLIVNGVDPRRIMLLTFTRRAAIEMTRRVRTIVADVSNAASCDLTWSATFHATGAQLLREYADRIGLKPSFTILDRSDAADLMNLVRHDLKQSEKKSRFPKKDTCLAIYSFAVNSGLTLEKVLLEEFLFCGEWEDELRDLFAEYVDAKQRQNVVDYDDLLLYWAVMMADVGLAEEIGQRFDHVLVDEYQDTNRLQAKILMRLKPDGQGVTVVGDDAQSIYSFRAATIRNILDFPNQFKPPAQVITLEQNYRSTQPILDACNAVMSLAKERFTKNLFSDRQSQQKPWLTTVVDEAAQARYVADQILRSREEGVPLKSQAVLFRASHHSAQLEIELGRRNIPFVKYGGLKFLEAAHIKDVISILRWCENPNDRVAGFRVLCLLPGIGPATASKILDGVAGVNHAHKFSFVEPPRATKEEWPAFVDLFKAIHTARKAWPADMHAIRGWYEPQLARLYDDAPLRMPDLSQLEQIAGNYKSRESFLTELTLDPPDATSGRAGAPVLDEEYTVLSTIHSAKGQEWTAVRVLNVVDGCIPSDMATGTPEELEEERRLLYVAMTRAKNELDLVVPLRFYTHSQSRTGDRHMYACVSRFVSDPVDRAFDRRIWPSATNADQLSTSISGVAVDVASTIKKMWNR